MVYTIIKHRRIIFASFFLLLSISTACATEYTVRPTLSNEFGVSVAGEYVQELEVKTIPYWYFLLWLACIRLSTSFTQVFPNILPLLGGYERVRRSNTLDNLNRKKLYGFIQSRSGAYFNEIVKRTGLNRGTVRYHVDVLETQHMIVSHKVNGKIRYFQNGSTYDEKEKTVIAGLRDDIDRRIVLEILNNGCNTNGALAERIGVSASTMSWHIRRLMEQEIVRGDKEGCYTIYRINSNYLESVEKYVQTMDSLRYDKIKICNNT
ncbi:winged helix-turn-helix transcriptional regulator [Methanococcoides burtonii]|uniref:winged helix-turn-helix transcriptional regulator n=1 Tax=Methanococcoides burtonii TaxID=29291 RepID=UPI000324266D|nr:winged helix-turn-helix transcriptional regulator [Methanococcoides burtonii]